jgi:hypothetical protein
MKPVKTTSKKGFEYKLRCGFNDCNSILEPTVEAINTHRAKKHELCCFRVATNDDMWSYDLALATALNDVTDSTPRKFRLILGHVKCPESDCVNCVCNKTSFTNTLTKGASLG